MTLKDLKKGMNGTVLRIDGEGALRRRLIDMGVTPGTEITVRSVAPLGDPIKVFLRGYELSVRAEDAARIHISAKRTGAGVL